MCFNSLEVDTAARDNRFPVTKWYFDHLAKLFMENTVEQGFLKGFSTNSLLSKNFKSE